MYLSDRDLEYAVSRKGLILEPQPEVYGPSGVDLHLDSIQEARVWNPRLHEETQQGQGAIRPSVGFRVFDYQRFAEQYSIPVPRTVGLGRSLRYREGNRVIVRPGGFFLWQTKEAVGTPEANARYICFINGKSTRARLGLVVHLTAPTIEAGWWGHVTLELGNLGPFRLALEEGDAIAQVVVAMLSSPPRTQKIARGIEVGQATVSGGKKRRRK